MKLILLFLCLYGYITLSESIKDCKRNYSVRKNAIILTKVSILRGAEFIHKQKVDLFQDCYALCCSNPKCTVAVYDNKQHHSCYMFNCLNSNRENVCLFTEHNHYIAMLELPHKTNDNNNNIRKIPTEGGINRNDNIKSNDRVSNGNDGGINGDSSINNNAIDAGLGEMCGQMRKCGPVNSMCTAGTCICQNGYLGQRGKCVRSVCPKPELMFQCTDTSKTPFCVAIYDRCNGLAECGDGSDEVGCQSNHKNSNRHFINSNNSNTQSNIVSRRPPNSAQSSKSADSNTESLHKSSSSSTNHNSRSNKMTNQRSTDNFPWSQHTSNTKNVNKPKLGNYNTSPLAENQLLLLESKNNLPNYKDRIIERQKIQQKQTDKDRDLYKKLKQEVYPHDTKHYDDYYSRSGSSSDRQKSPSRSDRYSNHIRNRWNDYDYDYSPSDTASDSDLTDWYKNSNQVDSGSRYIAPESRYKNYQPNEYEEDNNYESRAPSDHIRSKPRGRYISDSDYFSPRDYMGHSSIESMTGSHKHRKNENSKKKEAVNRIFIKPKDFDSKSKLKDTDDKLLQETSKKTETDTSGGSLNQITNNNEFGTAVIALSLGLLITAILLVAIAIKMRTWRKRLRRGGKKHKSLTTDENDYLINGMYL